MPSNQNQKSELSYDTKLIITIILLVTVYPIGLILMWIWKMFPLWVRWVLSSVVFLPFLAVIIIAIISTSMPNKMVDKVKDTRNINQKQYNTCLSMCSDVPATEKADCYNFCEKKK